MLLDRLLDNLALSVEAFATCRVASGWRLRLPPVDWVTLHYVVGGEGGVGGRDGRTRPLVAGTMAVVPPHLVHSLQCGPPPYGDAEPTGRSASGELPEHRAGPTAEDEDPLRVVCGRIEVTFGGGLGLFHQLHEVLLLDFSDDAGMKSNFEAMMEEAASGRPGSRAMTSALMHETLIRVFRELCDLEECSVSWLRALEDPALAPVVETMIERPDKPHTVASLAAKAYMSRSTFARRFRESFGQPPLAYLRGVRLRHAAKLLKKSPPLPVPTVARRSGFSSRSQFSRAFRSYFGCSPTEYRS
jgi:AraC-like DNA-binding protein